MPPSAPLFGYGGFPEPELPPPAGEGLRRWMGDEHHAQRAPDEHLCTCGRIREVCVRDEVRALWHEMVDDSTAVAPKSPPAPPVS